MLIALVGLSPLGNALILPLEQRFPPWDASRGPPDGIVVLGGAISPDVSAARGAVALNEAAERITVAAELARRYPNARIIFSGGSNALIFDEGAEAAFAVRQLEDLGVAPERIIAEDSRAIPSRMRCSRAVLADPKPGERWLLVTSALSYAARDGGFQGGRLSRSSPIRSIGARAGRSTQCGRSLRWRRAAPDRYRRA